MSRTSCIWTTTFLLTIIAVFLLLFAFPSSPIRPFVLFGFLLFCPGMALTQALGISNHPSETVTFATGLSIALDAICSSALLYAGIWSTALITMILVWLTLICILIYLFKAVLRESSIHSLQDLEATFTQLQIAEKIS